MINAYTSRRRRVAHLDMAPPLMAAIVPVTYKDKEPQSELHNAKFSGNHQRTPDYFNIMNTYMTRIHIKPYADGAVSVITNAFTTVDEAKAQARAQSQHSRPQRAADTTGDNTKRTARSLSPSFASRDAPPPPYHSHGSNSSSGAGAGAGATSEEPQNDTSPSPLTTGAIRHERS